MIQIPLPDISHTKIDVVLLDQNRKLKGTSYKNITKKSLVKGYILKGKRVLPILIINNFLVFIGS